MADKPEAKPEAKEKSEKKSEAKRSTVLTEERNAFKAGQPVEYDGKLAKVVEFGFLELPRNPGGEIKYSDSLVATLQLPALTPGGMPEYAYMVPADEMTSLKDDPKKLRSMQQEWNALLGDPVPKDEEKEKAEEPEIRQKGAGPEASKTSSTRGKEGKAEKGAGAKGAAEAPPAGGRPPRTIRAETPLPIDTSKPEKAPAKSEKRAEKKAEKKAAPKKAKKK